MLRKKRIIKSRTESTPWLGECNFKNLADNANDAIVVATKSGRGLQIEYVNKSASRLFGFSAKELRKKSLKELVSPEFHSVAAERFKRILAGLHVPARYELKILNKTREAVDVELSSSMVNWNGQNADMVVFREIRERKLLERERHLLITATESVSRAKDFKSALAVILANICDATGWRFGEVWTPDAHGTLRCDNVVYNCGVRQSEKKRYAALSKGVSFTPGVGLPGRIWRTGSHFWVKNLSAGSKAFVRSPLAAECGIVSVIGVPVLINKSLSAVLLIYIAKEQKPEEDKRLLEIALAVLSQLNMMMKRKLAEDALQVSEKRLKIAQRIGMMGSWERDIRTNKISWSDEIYNIFGLKRSDGDVTFDHLINKIIHPDDRETVVSHIDRTLKTGRAYSVDFRIMRPDGAIRVIHSEAKLGYDYFAKSEKLSGIAQDITDRKKAEERLSDKTRELQSLNKELHELAMRLTTLKQTERRKLAVILHEGLGQNLAAIKMVFGDIVGKCRCGCIYAAESIPQARRLLDESIKTTRMLTADLYPVDIEELGVEEALRWYAGTYMKSTGLKVALSIGNGSLDAVRKDSGEIAFGFVRECLQNVFKYAVARRVGITCRKARRSVVLSVKDDGVGFDQTKIKTMPGRGFGLILMRELAQSRGGCVKIKSSHGAGTEVVLELPTGGNAWKR